MIYIWWMTQPTCHWRWKTHMQKSWSCHFTSFPCTVGIGGVFALLLTTDFLHTYHSFDIWVSDAFIFESESHINAPVCIIRCNGILKCFVFLHVVWMFARLGTHFASFCKKWRGSVKFAKSLQEEGLKSLTCYLRCAICIPVNLIFKQIVNTI